MSFSQQGDSILNLSDKLTTAITRRTRIVAGYKEETKIVRDLLRSRFHKKYEMKMFEKDIKLYIEIGLPDKERDVMIKSKNMLHKGDTSPEKEILMKGHHAAKNKICHIYDRLVNETFPSDETSTDNTSVEAALTSVLGFSNLLIILCSSRL